MKKVKFHDKEQVTLADLESIAQLAQDNGLAQLVQHLIIGANRVLDGGEVAESSPPAMTVDVGACVGYHKGIPIIGDSTTVDVSPADPSLDRIDVVAIGYAVADSTTAQRTFWNPSTESEYNDEVYIREHDSFEAIVVAGTPAATPVAPTQYQGEPITDNYLILAEIYVTAAASQINSGDITDEREIFAVTSGYVKWYAAGMTVDGYIDGDGWPVDEDCVILGISVYQETQCGATDPDGDVYTVRKSGVDTDLEVKLNSASGNPESDSEFVEFSKGDRLGVYATADPLNPGSDAHVAVRIGKKLPAVNLS